MDKDWIRLIKISVLFASILGFISYIYYSPLFEREDPKVELNGTVYWNFKTPFTFKISDNNEIGDYKVEIKDEGKITTVAQGEVVSRQKEFNITLSYPKNAFLPKTPEAKMLIEVSDRSLWNFFRPNTARLELRVICDKTPPVVSVISNSYAITRGGSSVVIFEAKDPNLKDVYIKTANGRVFDAQPFVKKGFYVSLIAWELEDSRFSASVVATDLAGNKSSVPIRYFLRDMAYKDAKIELKDNFLNSKIMELSAAMQDTPQTTPLDRFVYVNNTMREANEKLIERVTTRIGNNSVDSFFTEPFLPIKNASVVGSFGDHRSYILNGKVISESYHKGVDFASVKEDIIVSPNNGVVIFAEPNGIYGNTSIVYHGLGLFTLYGHCSSFLAKTGELVKKNQPIAKTGLSGLAFGDHLHYGVLIQGVEVRPVEWLDAKWIKLNITNVINEAKDIISGMK
ncbi:MAG TPA: M23 family metallopeptidase [Campylobacterales bacterium]|nr:M23 family metallopeptidase [Campylobacterales bacterium]